MKHIKSIVENSRLLRLVAACAVIFVANIFPMRSKPHIAAGSQMMRMKREGLRNELTAAHWSQEKIKELREKRDYSTKGGMYPGGKLIYPARRSSAQQEGPAEKVLNDLLIDHYAQKIRQALQAIPVDERATWASDFRLILSIGLDHFLKEGGVKRYYAGQLPTIGGVDDGSEIGIAGTKFRAMEKIKNETNDFATIPFDASLSKTTPAEFFKSLAYDSVVSTGAKMGPDALQQRQNLEREWEGIDI